MAVQSKAIAPAGRLIDLSGEVRNRAKGRCEYCRIPAVAFKRPFHIEHIVARQHGGLTQLENLAFACWTCNFKKGPNLTGIDPETGQIARSQVLDLNSEIRNTDRDQLWREGLLFA